MMKNANHIEPAEITEGGGNAALRDNDVMIDVDRFYSNNLEDSH